MLQMSGRQPRERAHGAAISGGDSTAIPRFWRKPLEKAQVGFSQISPLGHQSRKIPEPKTAVRRDIFVPGRQIRLAAIGQTRDSVPEHSFGVGTVFKNLADRPRVRSVNAINLFGADAAGQLTNPIQLLGEQPDRTIALDATDQVAVVVTVELAGIGATTCDAIHVENVGG